MIDWAIHILQRSAEILSPPWFTFLGALFEEVLAPIPSPLVMTLGGSLAAVDQRSFHYLWWLALTGTAGKTIGAWVIYLLADKFENVLTSRFGRFLGVSHQQIESVGAKLGHGWKDGLAIFILRVLPIIPTAPVSLIAGILKMDLKTYLLGSALGIFFRNMFYLYFGFTSLGALENINNNFGHAESVGSIVFLLFLAALGYYLYRKRRQLWPEG
ncbi:MAG TPA: VTT domain-containing protein [Candidatus Andersenbacteria bacterium]|nr:VTT domain-containing protein [Candidatus Andersenbacteria bacterium]